MEDLDSSLTVIVESMTFVEVNKGDNVVTQGKVKLSFV